AIDFGYYYYLQHNIEGAAREGARAGVVPGATNGDVTTAVNAVMNSAGLSGQSISGSCTVASGTMFTITVQMPYQPLGVPPARVPTTKVKGIMTMQKE